MFCLFTKSPSCLRTRLFFQNSSWGLYLPCYFLRGQSSHRLHPVGAALHLSLFIRGTDSVTKMQRCQQHQRPRSRGKTVLQSHICQHLRFASCPTVSVQSHLEHARFDLQVCCRCVMYFNDPFRSTGSLVFSEYHGIRTLTFFLFFSISQQHPTKSWPWACIDLGWILFSHLLYDFHSVLPGAFFRRRLLVFRPIV